MSCRLIRDTIALQPREGVHVEWGVMGGRIHKIALVAKMHEEVCEIEKSPTDALEYGDLVEAILTLAELNGVTPRMIEEARLYKLNTRGGFKTCALMDRSGRDVKYGVDQ